MVVAGPLLRCCCACSPCLIAAAWSGSGHRGFRMLKESWVLVHQELNSMGQSERPHAIRAKEGWAETLACRLFLRLENQGKAT